MTGIIPISSTPATMSSREIADLTGKRHDHVMRDIEAQLTELLGAEGLPKFGDTYRNEQNGQTYRMYRLPKRECLRMDGQGWRFTPAIRNAVVPPQVPRVFTSLPIR